MSDDRQKKLAADCFRRGTEAMMKQSWEYSCAMFRQSVNMVPENLLYRQCLRGVTEKRYNNNGTGASMAGMKVRETKASIKERRRHSDWLAVQSHCEDGLSVNPWDAELNGYLAEAAEALGWDEIAQWCRSRGGDNDFESGVAVLR